MKTTLFTTLAALVGTCMIASAQGEKKRPNRHQGPPPEMVKEFDKDGDGKLSDEERQSLRDAMKAKAEERRKEMMKKYDTDGDGKLSKEEREKASADRKAAMLKLYDKNGDGELSQDERAEMPRPPRGEGGPGGKGPGGKPPGDKPPGDKPAAE